ncbi:hypothetical protein HOD08_03370 [bacterium]|nr:hypothetical protein [bacterium]
MNDFYKIPEIPEVYGYLFTPFWQTLPGKILTGILILTFLAVLLFSGFFIFIKFFKKPEPLWMRALRMIHECSPDELKTKAAFKQAYFGLTGVVKWYFDERFGGSLTQQTDEELVSGMQKHGYEELIVEDVKALLDSSRSVKFADKQGARLQLEKDVARIESLIKRTIPSPGK